MVNGAVGMALRNFHTPFEQVVISPTGVNFLTPRPGKTRQIFGGDRVPYIYRGV
jgi:hypothetical protein